LASLTKVLVTTPAWMLRFQEKQADLEAPLRKYLPDFATPLGAQSVRRFLTHTSGALAWRPFFEAIAPELRNTPAGKEALRQALMTETPTYEPGTRQVYSDVGFALLGFAVEHAAAMPLSALARDRLFAPLDIDDLAFLQVEARDGIAVAATEDSPWRGGVLAGAVHDENTWAAGGCLGQSGLFGTTAGVARVMDEFRRALRGHGQLFDQPTIAEFMKRPPLPPPPDFRHGFDSPSAVGSSAGEYFGPATFGHLGFTGVSAWCDPAHELVVVLLTNRVHPTRDNEFIRVLRPLVHNAVIEELR
jgi:CubicO group peptidase (beta-lactamase class C family)